VLKTTFADQQADEGEGVKILEDAGVENGKKSKQNLTREKTKNESVAKVKEVSVSEVLNRIQSYHVRSCLLLKPGVKWVDHQVSYSITITWSLSMLFVNGAIIRCL